MVGIGLGIQRNQMMSNEEGLGPTVRPDTLGYGEQLSCLLAAPWFRQAASFPQIILVPVTYSPSPGQTSANTLYTASRLAYVVLLHRLHLAS